MSAVKAKAPEQLPRLPDPRSVHVVESLQAVMAALRNLDARLRALELKG